MLNTLINHPNLGSPRNILSVYHLVSSSKYKSLVNLRKYFMDISHEYVFSFDGIITLLVFIEAISISGGKIFINPDFVDGKEINDLTTFCLILNRKLIKKLRNTKILDELLPLEKTKYDMVIDRVVIQNSAIPLKLSSIRNLLIKTNGFEIFKDLPSFLVLSKELEEFIKLKTRKQRKILTVDEFLRLQEYKILQGDKSEEFVLRFELDRLSNHPLHKGIKRISTMDVGAGFDVISLLNLESTKLDMFIEVKSYKQKPYFYWSANEIEFARKTGHRYFLYIVDIQKFHEINYTPLIIQNPYELVFCNPRWLRENTSWLFSIPL